MADRRQNCRNLSTRYHPHRLCNNFVLHSHAMSPSTISTVSKVQQRHRSLKSSVHYSLHDNTSSGYEWLLPGWIAEERNMPNGRIYRICSKRSAFDNLHRHGYYYDPSGNLYRTKTDVLLAWEEAGILVLDP